jgi:integrase
MSKPTNTPTGVIARRAPADRPAGPGLRPRAPRARSPRRRTSTYAARLRIEILGKIERGTFSLAEYFPDSPRVAKDTPASRGSSSATSGCGRRSEIEHSTLHHYEQTLGSKHFDDWRPLHLPAIDYRKLMAKLAAAGAPEDVQQHRQRAVDGAGVRAQGQAAARSAARAHRAPQERPKAKPDPFTLAEVDVCCRRCGAEGVNYYEFAFFSGLRPSEQIALQWKHVDLRAGTHAGPGARSPGRSARARRRARSARSNSRARARAALERQRAVSQLAGPTCSSRLDGESYTSTDGPLDAFWKAAHEAVAAYRVRDARQTRHTFATMCLHAGLKPGWVAGQLGHSVEMFYRVYSKWIEAQDQGAERKRQLLCVHSRRGRARISAS